MFEKRDVKSIQGLQRAVNLEASNSSTGVSTTTTAISPPTTLSSTDTVRLLAEALKANGSNQGRGNWWKKMGKNGPAGRWW
mmetsp:Transcript_4701/g.17667  ORF Transcript_4701/g.17667 Transcript_4701/m.17667 type:complete len:81 (-) Transcript_4701:66-308(-)